MSQPFLNIRTIYFFTILLLIHLSNNAQTAKDSLTEKHIVMFGNSITFQGNWDEVLHRSDIVKWGMPGYTTGQLIWTIKNVLQDYPGTKIWFLEGGINDISLGVPVRRIFENFKIIADSLKRSDIIPVVQSTIYQYHSSDKNKKVKKVNQLVMNYCSSHYIAYIDLNAILSAKGELKSGLTTDGTHLNKEAYVLWAALIKAVLAKYSWQ